MAFATLCVRHEINSPPLCIIGIVAQLTPEDVGHSSHEQVGTPFLHPAPVRVEVHMPHWLVCSQAPPYQGVCVCVYHVYELCVGCVQADGGGEAFEHGTSWVEAYEIEWGKRGGGETNYFIVTSYGNFYNTIQYIIFLLAKCRDINRSYRFNPFMTPSGFKHCYSYGQGFYLGGI